MLLKGQCVLITGATRGIGRGIALKFAEQGADLAFTYVSDNSKPKAEALVEELTALGVKAKAYQSDAADYAAAEQLIKDGLNDFGQINTLINNAGITRDNLLMRMSEEQWDQVMRTNLKSVFNLTKQIARPMMKQRGGSIITISSIVGLGGNAGQSNYAASKAGAIGFSKSMAKELGSRNIRCNVVAPGFIETEMTDAVDPAKVEEWKQSIPLKRGGTPEDVANTCVYLASDLSSYVTGQVISVCGGLQI